LTELQINTLTKIVFGTIIFSSLISVSLLSGVSATTNPITANSKTNQVIVGDTENYREFEGLAATMEPWEATMRTDPLSGAFEWWYWQGEFDDGSSTQMTWLAKPFFDNDGELQPYINFFITTPNGTNLFGQNKINSNDFQSAGGALNLTMGKNWARGDIDTVNMHIEPTSNGLGGDLTFTSAAPPTRFGGSGLWYFDTSLTKFSGLVDPMPFAKVNGTLTYEGQTHEVNGTGYFDKQWGTANINAEYDGWYWSTGHYGNYTIDSFFAPTSAKYNHTITTALYLAKGNGPSEVLVETMHGLNATTSGSIAGPDGNHTYPEVITLQYKNGSNSVTLNFTNPEIINTRAAPTNTNATTYGESQYFRLGGNGTLNVQWDGTNETASEPAVMEVFYTH